MVKYLRAKTNGIVMDYHERLASNPDWELVTEQEAFPERFAPVDIKVREKKVELNVPVEVVAPPVVAPELAQQKGQVFGNINIPKTQKKPKTDINVAGLEF